MRLLLHVLPIAFLVAYSQLVVKWRAQLGGVVSLDQDFLHKLGAYFSDVYILSAYTAALLGSFLWLIVVSRIPLSIGFPVYVGVTFLLVMVGSWVFLGESISMTKMAAATLILVGIVLGGMES
jgi:multidrug transporter EmrE-like cation transporter